MFQPEDGQKEDRFWLTCGFFEEMKNTGNDDLSIL
jgi:hypothetical protein